MRLIRLAILYLGACVSLSLYYSWAQGNAHVYDVKEVKRVSDEERLVRGDKLRAYRVFPETGRAERVQMPDTLTQGTHDFTLAERRSIAISYLGNIYSPWQSKIFFDRADRLEDFAYLSSFEGLLGRPNQARWYNTKSPFTFIRYQKVFGDDTQEEMVDIKLSTNLGKRLNMGGEFSRVNALGFYEANKNKSTRYRIFGSYTSDRYDLYTYMANDRIRMTENGGVTDLDYLKNPDKYSNGRVRIGPKDIPVLIPGDKYINSLSIGHFFASQRYKLGSYRSLPSGTSKQDKDSGAKEGQPDSLAFVPVGSITHTLYYTKQWRHAYSEQSGEEWEKIFGPAQIKRERVSETGATTSYIQPQDSMRMNSLSNTFALSLIEGFRPWVKFGLSAYLRTENHWISMLDSRTGGFKQTDKFFSTFIGGELVRTSGAGLNFRALGEIGAVGKDLGALRLEGQAQTAFRLMGRSFSLKADARLLNHRPSYFAEKQHGTFDWRDEELKFVRRLEIGGRATLDSWGTWAEARTATLNNYIYWDDKRQARQLGSIAQVAMLRVGHQAKVGPLNWSFSAAYQTTTASEAIPLPALSAMADVWFDFLLFDVLRLHLGANAFWHSAYYAPAYAPTIQQFVIQSQDKIGGGLPLVNAYANFKLKNARFYIRAYNVLEAFTQTDRLSLYRYPYNPMYLGAGIVFDLNN